MKTSIANELCKDQLSSENHLLSNNKVLAVASKGNINKIQSKCNGYNT